VALDNPLPEAPAPVEAVAPDNPLPEAPAPVEAVAPDNPLPEAPAPVEAVAPDNPLPEAPAPAPEAPAPAPEAPALEVPPADTPAPQPEVIAVAEETQFNAEGALPVLDAGMQVLAPDAPADETAIVEAAWTHTDQPVDGPQVWALHGAPLAPADPAVPPVLPPVPAPAAVDVPAPVYDAANAVASGQLPDGIPHLSSPQNPPPGTSDEPVGPQSGPNVTYLKELWHAIQTQQVSKGGALLALTQRPLSTPVTNDPSLGTAPTDGSAPLLVPGAPAPGPADDAPAQ
jgi:hypothetical protein